jgi:RNA polymerase sigma-70 factor (ECF subfamily)
VTDRFEALVLPHLDAAYKLARWLARNDQDAQDIVQEAALRALRYIDGLRGDNARPWLLQIVRHNCASWLRANRPAELVVLAEGDDPSQHWTAPESEEPHAAVLRKAERVRVNAALASLPIVYREVLVLRELEELSYKEIALIAGVPVGTVMSRLARGRALMRRALLEKIQPELGLTALATAS